jgi:ParB family chromosome partitioning protein
MTTSAAGKGGQKKDEKVEKRRALGRGLESLLPGPRVVSGEVRVPGAERGPQGLKPESSLVPGGTAEAVPFPVADGDSGLHEASTPEREVPPSSSGGAGEKQVPHFVRNDKRLDAGPTAVSVQRSLMEISASEEIEAGQPRAAVPTRPVPTSVGRGDGPAELPAPEEREQREAWPEEPETIEIQAMAIPSNLVINLDIVLIEKNPYQTRYLFDEEQMEELRDSILEHGVVQPIVVRPGAEEGRYILVLGERRLRASKMAGRESVPAVIRRVSPQQAAEMTVLENVVRQDLNPLEQAEAFRVLSQEFAMTQVQIAERIGVSREKVTNYMRLLRLPKPAMEHLMGGRLSFSDCREILALDDPEQIEKLAEEAVTKKLKVEDIERRVSEIKGFLPSAGQAGTLKKSGGARWVDPNVRAAQLEMERTLGMRVRIRDRHGKGRIVIEYASVDDYERVTGLLRGKVGGRG